MRGYLDRGYRVVKMKIGGAPLDEDLRTDRSRAEGDRLGRRGSRSTPTDASISRPASHTPRRSRRTSCSGTRRAGDPLDYALQAEHAGLLSGPMATGENLFSHQDARNLIRYGGMRPDRDWLQFDCALSLRTGRISADARDAGRARLVADALHSAWRAPDVAQHRGRSRARRQRVLPGSVPAIWRLSRLPFASRTATSSCPTCPASALRANPI